MHEFDKSERPFLKDYVLQQICHFRLQGEEFRMVHAGTEWLDKSYEELREEIIASAPVAQRLKGVSPEDRLQGLSPEDLLAGLPAGEREKLRELLAQDRADSK